MSLDVYLKYNCGEVGGESGIFIRENGTIKEITREEWDTRHPGRVPFVVKRDDDYVYKANITHNLNKMAMAADIYEYLWRPDEIGIVWASELIGPLDKGLLLLKSMPEYFKQYNPKNGWGDYDGLVDFVHV